LRRLCLRSFRVSSAIAQIHSKGSRGACRSARRCTEDWSWQQSTGAVTPDTAAELAIRGKSGGRATSENAWSTNCLSLSISLRQTGRTQLGAERSNVAYARTTGAKFRRLRPKNSLPKRALSRRDSATALCRKLKPSCFTRLSTTRVPAPGTVSDYRLPFKQHLNVPPDIRWAALRLPTQLAASCSTSRSTSSIARRRRSCSWLPSRHVAAVLDAGLLASVTAHQMFLPTGFASGRAMTLSDGFRAAHSPRPTSVLGLQRQFAVARSAARPLSRFGLWACTTTRHTTSLSAQAYKWWVDIKGRSAGSQCSHWTID
jgi:hypothetical protein